ncbi:hypothetical protein [Citricoccus sp. GCM10030269]|uniref:hypothetical protein n=1 Tax=Citricoccus sp. GCM10030269 TaxID=3273388 RepID=UPI003622DEBB
MVVANLRREGMRDTDVRSLRVARVTRGVAVVWAVVSLSGALVDALGKLYASTVNVHLPVETFWPELPAAAQVSGATAHVVTGGFSQATVDVTGLEMPTRIWLASGDVLQGATNVAIGVVVAMLCTSLLRRNPFHLALIRGLNVTAMAVMVGGIGWQVCDAVAGGLASAKVLGIDGGIIQTDQVNWDDINHVIGLPKPGYDWSVDFWPIWAGLALLAVSAAFRYGQRLQRDTVGLI